MTNNLKVGTNEWVKCLTFGTVLECCLYNFQRYGTYHPLEIIITICILLTWNENENENDENVYVYDNSQTCFGYLYS